MRTLVLASLALCPACLLGTGNISGDDQTGSTCGDGIVSGSETCDDGNTVDGDGCSATCQTETVNTPHAVLSVDKTTVVSDLNVETVITVTATSMMNFSGDLTLTVAAADGSAAPIADWVTTFDAGTLEVSSGGTATAMLTLSAMGDTAALAGNVTITATGGNSVAPSTTTLGVTFNPVLHIAFADNGGACSYPVGHGIANPWKIKAGRQIAVYNGSATLGMVVHTGGLIAGFPHEEPRVAPGTPAGLAYLSTISLTAQPLDEDQFYCHDPGTPLTMLTDPGSANYQNLRVVQ